MTQEIKNLLDVIFKLGDYINTYWIFYAVFNIAVFGWLISGAVSGVWQKNLIVTFAYAIVVSMNLFAQIRATKFMGLAIDELKALIAEDRQVTRTQPLRAEVLNFRYIDRSLIVAAHLAMDTFVIGCIWLRGRF